MDTSFRELLRDLKYGDRATHFLHPYPGKLIAHIPYFFLRATQFTGAETRVFDPFCGSGTTLVEALIRGVAADGADVNPFAVLLSSAKCTLLDPVELVEEARGAVGRMNNAELDPRNIPNRDMWYTAETLLALLRLRISIDGVQDYAIRQALLVGLSATARNLSFADPRLPVPVRVRPDSAKSAVLRARFAAVEARARTGDVSTAFLAGVMQSAARYEKLLGLVPANPPAVTCRVKDVLSPESTGSCAPDASYDLVITSPPYCGAQKYVRSTSHALAWTTQIGPSTLADLEAATIGREYIRKGRNQPVVITYEDAFADELVHAICQRNATRGRIAASYLSEMDIALGRIAMALRPGGHVVLVVGDNLVAGEIFPATRLLTDRLERRGLEKVVVLRDSIPSRGLMTKRNGRNGPISHEHVVVMRKPIPGVR